MKFRQWISNSYNISRLFDHPFIEKRLIQASEPTVAYFFWGRKTAEIVPLIQNNKVKTAIRLHGHDLYHHRMHTSYIPYQKAQIKAADKVLCVSQNGINYLSERYTNLSHHLLLNRLGTLTIPLANRSKDGKFRLITCSSLIPLKRVHLIPEALSNITETQICWTHIGDGPEMERIKAASFRLPSNIEARFTGWVGSRSVTTYYSNKDVDLFINVSQTEGVPVSIMEAMAAGIPCMATNVGGVSEIVNEENGVLLDPNISAKELASQLTRFMGLNTDDINKKRCAAVKTFQNEYEATSNARKLSQELNNLWNDSHN
jgi:glycosyltransferase involved in cell wall biosynthesis